MQKINEVTILIPARLNSQRLPNKLLLEINGLPIIEHVRRRAELNELERTYMLYQMTKRY